MVNANPFLLDLTANSGIFILAVLIGLAVFLFFRKALSSAGVLSFFIGFLLLYNEINFLIAGIAFFIGVMLIFGGKIKK